MKTAVWNGFDRLNSEEYPGLLPPLQRKDDCLFPDLMQEHRTLVPVKINVWSPLIMRQRNRVLQPCRLRSTYRAAIIPRRRPRILTCMKLSPC